MRAPLFSSLISLSSKSRLNSSVSLHTAQPPPEQFTRAQQQVHRKYLIVDFLLSKTQGSLCAHGEQRRGDVHERPLLHRSGVRHSLLNQIIKSSDRIVQEFVALGEKRHVCDACRKTLETQLVRVRLGFSSYFYPLAKVGVRPLRSRARAPTWRRAASAPPPAPSSTTSSRATSCATFVMFLK